MDRIVRVDTMIYLLILTALISLSGGQVITQESRLLVISNGTIIDGTGVPPLTEHVLVVEGNQIIGIFPEYNYILPSNAVEIDAGAGTILPGLFNAHVHDSASVDARRRDFLEYGVTSVCDTGSQLSTISYFSRNFTNRDERIARGFRSGPYITAPDGYPDVYYQTRLNLEVNTATEARLATLDLIGRGVDFIKIALEPGTQDDNWALLSDAQLTAIIDTAHANDRIVQAHVLQARMLDTALRHDVDVIHYVPFHEMAFDMGDSIVRAFLRGTMPSLLLPTSYINQLEQMVAQDIILVPTLEVSLAGAYDRNFQSDQERVLINFGMEAVRVFHELGGRVAVGNAYNSLGYRDGLPLREMQLLLEAGLSPMDVIVASTQNSAMSCGQGDSLGTLETGKLADIIIVNGNPLDDIHDLQNITYVILDGEVVAHDME